MGWVSIANNQPIRINRTDQVQIYTCTHTHTNGDVACVFSVEIHLFSLGEVSVIWIFLIGSHLFGSALDCVPIDPY